jgi:hypothetical protein
MSIGRSLVSHITAYVLCMHVNYLGLRIRTSIKLIRK